MALHLNIGLAKLRPSAALALINDMGIVRLGFPCISPLGSEPTLVVTVPSSTSRTTIAALAVGLGEDCISAYDPDGPQGWMIGPRCGEWGPFDPAQFVMPTGKLLAGPTPRYALPPIGRRPATLREQVG